MAADPLRARLLDADVQFLIRSTARRLCRARGFRAGEFPDLAQDLAAHLLRRLPAYDPGRASFYCFAQVVLDRHAKTLIEHRNAACRNPAGEVPLDALPGTGGEPTSLALSLAADAHARRLARFDLPEAERSDVVLDVREAIAALPPDLQDLAQRRTDASVARIARDTGTSAHHVRRRVGELRQAFEAFGLGNYLDNSSHDG